MSIEIKFFSLKKYVKICRIFDKEPEGEKFKARIRKIVNIRLEEIRR